MEHPVLRLALLGFEPVVVQRVGTWLSRESPGWPLWRIATPDQADAWIINGPAITHTGADGSLSFSSGWVKQPLFTVDPSETERPLALALPLPQDLESREVVDINSESDLRLATQRFEAWLRPLRTEFALGAHLVGMQGSLGKHVYHLKSKHALIAVVDLIDMRVGLSPTARPIDMEEAGWEKRPPSAADFPQGFVRMNVSQVMWQYAMRTEREIMPARYRRDKIYSRRQSGVPARWLQDEHLQILSELKSASATFDELAVRTGILPSDLVRYLASLYFAGAITTDERRAKRSSQRSPVNGHSSLPPSLAAPTGPPSVMGDQKGPDTTVPVRLI